MLLFFAGLLKFGKNGVKSSAYILYLYIGIAV